MTSMHHFSQACHKKEKLNLSQLTLNPGNLLNMLGFYGVMCFGAGQQERTGRSASWI